MASAIPADDTIRYLHIPGQYVLGAKRNMCCQYACGDVIMHWDDDDYSAPGRMLDQVQRLLDSNKPVTGYNLMYFTNGSKWWRYRGAPDYALGTSLCYRRDWWAANPFPPTQVGEDNSFVLHAKKLGQIASVPAGSMLIATNHGKNTSPRQLCGGNWEEVATA